MIAWIDTQRPQRRVVPAKLERRRQAFLRGVVERVGAQQDLGTPIGRGERERGVDRLLRQHDRDDVFSAREIGLVAIEVVVRHGSCDHGDVLEQQPVLLGQMIGVLDRLAQRVETDNDIVPVVGGRQRHLDLGDDAVGAVGVADFLQIRAGEIEEARRFFHGGDAQADDVAEIAQAPPADRADTAGTAGNKSAERRGLVGRGMEPQFLAGDRAQFLVDRRHDGAGLGDDAALGDALDLAHGGKIEHDAARERHRLAVVAGAGAARRDGYAERVAGGERLHQFGLARGRDDDVGRDAIELALQDRRIPIEIAALHLDERWIVFRADGAKALLQSGDVITRHVASYTDPNVPKPTASQSASS